MAAITKVGDPSITSTLPTHENVISGLRAAEAIASADLCTIGSDGLVSKRDAAGDIHGVAALKAQAGEAVTLHRGVRYGEFATITPGAKIYSSETVPGGLDTATATNAVVVGFGLPDGRIQFTF